MADIRKQAQQARKASAHLALLSTEAKNGFLAAIAKALKKNIPAILEANGQDIAMGKKKGMPEGMLDRILLTKERMENIISDLLEVIELKDPVGEIIEDRMLPNGLNLKRVRVPLGVIGMIYEARPNVTVDCVALCLKSGNAVMLKGGSDARNSNREIVRIIKDALTLFDSLNPEKPVSHAVQFIDSTDRAVTEEFLHLTGLIDVIIPRGGKGLIDFVKENSRVPIIETGASVVHAFVDEKIDMENAVKVVMNAKLRRTAICNTLDSLLLHTRIAENFLKEFIKMLFKEKKVLELRADPVALKILKKIKLPGASAVTIKPANQNDFDMEFLAPVLAVKTVKSVHEAIEHIAKHSLKHSEAILTEDPAHAEEFLNAVDAACVYWNVSTQFSDGAQFGLGAEIGISTQKLHARGPFALEGLTSYKWVVRGNYQTRPA